MPLEHRKAMVPVLGINGASSGIAFTCDQGVQEARWWVASLPPRRVADRLCRGVACVASANSVIVLHLVGQDGGEDGAGDGAEDGGADGESKGL